MRSSLVFFACALSLLFGGELFSREAELPNGSFEEELPGSWKVTGIGEVDESEKVDGKSSLKLSRDPVNLPETGVVSEPFRLKPGVWEFSAATMSGLYSPDSSFNVSITLQGFGPSGEEIKSRRILALSGTSPWKLHKEKVTVPPGVVSGKIDVRFNKTHGSFRLDAVKLDYLGESLPMEGGDRKVVFRSNRIGNLFYPGDAVAFEMVLETPTDLPQDRRVVEWQVTDFYGSPQAGLRSAALESDGRTAEGWKVYRAVIDAQDLPLKTGPYYEIRTRFDLGATVPARETVSFAILPEARTRDLNPMDTPFGAHTWNATVFEYFPLAARLGIRRCLVFWDFPAEAPYTPAFDEGRAWESRLGWPRRFGMAPYGVLYPMMRIEHGEKPEYSDEALREGIRQSIEKYRGAGLWGFQIGNEPPSWNPAMVKRDVEAYRVAYETIKKTDPDFFVIGSAIGPNETFFRAGFQPWQDAYNIHAYADLGELRQEMQKYRALFEKYGGEKPIWSTEIGSMSQGLPRDVIARDILRKAVCFLADGGGFFTWFSIGGMPDPDGERSGGYSDSMDLFAARYNMHLPRLDAVSYYHLIDQIGTKRFVEERLYSGGGHAFLFRDAQGQALIVLWNASSECDVALPLDGVFDVGLVAMNGVSRRLSAESGPLQLRVGSDPVFVSFRSDRFSLPAEMPAAEAMCILEKPDEMIEGREAFFRIKESTGRPVSLSGPFGWKIVRDSSPEGEAIFRVGVPAVTAARLATFTVTDETVARPGNTHLTFSVPVRSKIEVQLRPLAGRTEGDAAIELTLVNHAPQPQEVDWKAEILGELPMAGGTYRISDERPSRAFLAATATGRVTLAPSETRNIPLALSETDRQTLYKIRATAADAATGNTVKRERWFGGFARAVRVSGGVKVDGVLDETFWSQAPAYRIDEARQFHAVEPEAKPWTGREDLSGTVRFAWDESHLYVAVQVVDDVFANPASDSQIWRQDGLQFLIDPFRQERESRGRYDYSMGLGRKGIQAWCHKSADAAAPAGEAPDIRLAVVPGPGGPGNRIYEVAIPWTRLAPFRPEAGSNFGLTMVLNEDDGPGRLSTMGWFGGVHLKESLFVGDVVLAADDH
jgi:hypothetical protein